MAIGKTITSILWRVLDYALAIVFFILALMSDVKLDQYFYCIIAYILVIEQTLLNKIKELKQEIKELKNN